MLEDSNTVLSLRHCHVGVFAVCPHGLIIQIGETDTSWTCFKGRIQVHAISPTSSITNAIVNLHVMNLPKAEACDSWSWNG